MKNRKGVTLLELILALALIGIVITIGTNIFLFGNKAQTAVALEADMQANTRLVSEQINNITRFATKTHTIPASSFQYSETGVRDINTSYIGITKEGNVVIDKPVEQGNPLNERNVQVLAQKMEGIDYEIVFNKSFDDDGNELDALLSFSIVGVRDGKIATEIVSKIDVLNSLNIEYLGTPDDPAVALAYSMVDPGSQEWIEMSPDAYITLVLDRSGSMAWDLRGRYFTVDNQRMATLKAKAQKMIDRLANLNFNIYVSVIPFSNNANPDTSWPHDFKNLQNPTELQYVKNRITALTSDGNTNTGDGIRRAYWRLKNKADSLISNGQIDGYHDITQHMMVLVDGATNLETKTVTKVNFFEWEDESHQTLADGNVSYPHGWLGNKYYVGSHYSFSVSTNNNDYITYFGNNRVKPYKFEFEGVQKQAINSFVIGFSSDANDHVSLEAIGNAINGKQFEQPDGTTKRYILATNADELDFAFEQFEAEVENSLWVITRPQLWP